MAVRTMVVRAVRSRGSGALSRTRRWHGPTCRVRAAGNCRVHRGNAAGRCARNYRQRTLTNRDTLPLYCSSSCTELSTSERAA